MRSCPPTQPFNAAPFQYDAGWLRPRCGSRSAGAHSPATHTRSARRSRRRVLIDRLAVAHRDARQVLVVGVDDATTRQVMPHQHAIAATAVRARRCRRVDPRTAIAALPRHRGLHHAASSGIDRIRHRGIDVQRRPAVIRRGIAVIARRQRRRRVVVRAAELMRTAQRPPLRRRSPGRAAHRKQAQQRQHDDGAVCCPSQSTTCRVAATHGRAPPRGGRRSARTTSTPVRIGRATSSALESRTGP